MRPWSVRAFLTASVVASLYLPTSAEAAGAVLPLQGRGDPALLDVRLAVAVSPQGTTRWSDITIPDSTRVLWLVPARPNAMIAWAADGWLVALEDATAPRILRPAFPTTCDVPTNAERSMPWTPSALKRPAQAFTVYATADAVRSAASSRGFAITTDLDSKIGGLYAAGWNLVGLEIESTLGSASSGTLRVTDDGTSVLPLALLGTRTSDTRVTAFAIGAGVASTAGARDIDGSALRWGTTGSNFAAWRRDILVAGSGDAWLRESASHAALFDGTTVPGSTPAPSVVRGYLGVGACADGATGAGGSDGVVGGSLSASTFTCGGLDDLAIALDGLAPRTAVVTRWSGLIARGDLGTDRPLTFQTNGFQSQPAVRAGAYEPCVTPQSSAPKQPLAPGPSVDTPEEPTGGGTDVVYVSDGCGGGTTTTTTVEDDDTTTTTTSQDDCGGDSSTSSSSSSEGWDKSDDDSDSSDSCGSDSESSSSSKDSCGGSSSSSSSSGSSSDDGWDSEDNMSPKANKHSSLRLRPKHSRSPFSRMALFAVALILPLRRRARTALRL